MIETAYLDALSAKNLQSYIARMVDLLFTHSHEFDAIAFRGVSGALIAPSVAATLGKELLLVRKPNERAHTYSKVEGVKGEAQRYIILDDFISAGSTVNSILEAVREFDSGHKCVAIALYNWKGKTTERLRTFDGIPLWKTAISKGSR